MLLSIALFPLLAPRFWHHHYPKVSAARGRSPWRPVPRRLRRARRSTRSRSMAIVDYLPFIILLGALFTIGGGILVRGTLRGSPAGQRDDHGARDRPRLLDRHDGRGDAADPSAAARQPRAPAQGAHASSSSSSSWRTSAARSRPLGDPPLFLGFLHGVPFFWTLRLWRETALLVAVLCRGYLVMDAWHWRREEEDVRRAPQATARAAAHRRLAQPAFLAGVLAAVIVSGIWHPGSVSIFGVRQESKGSSATRPFSSMAAGSWLTTSPRVREQNDHAWEPVREVAILFAGDLRDHDPGPRDAARGRGRRARPHHPRRAGRRQLLLGHRRALVAPRQRADLSDVRFRRRSAALNPAFPSGRPFCG